MSDGVLNRDRARILRGRILEIFHEFFKNGTMIVARTQIERLAGGFTPAEVGMAINYLSMEGKEYLFDATARLDKRDKRAGIDFRITGKGLDLVDGTTEDEGVIFE